jgi:peptidoglycan/LPS O-acetylase OafA/YrhL
MRIWPLYIRKVASARPAGASVSGLDLLGFLRLILALSVAGFHLAPGTFPDAGRQAVAGFFCISGFLVTKIARETYSERPIDFLLNRFLRIFPMYWSCLLVVIAITLALPVAAQHPLLNLSVETDLPWWLNQIMIFNLAPSAGKIIGQSWSLEVELYFYLYIGLGTHRSFAVTFIGFVFLLIYAALALFDLVPAPFYWVPSTTGFLFYGGSLAYFLYPKLGLGIRSCLIGVAVLAAAMYILPRNVAPRNYNALVFISFAGSILVLLALPNIRIAPGLITRTANYCGRLTYPVFLLQIACAVLIAQFAQNNQLLLLGLSMPLTLTASVILVHAVELPLEKIRRKIRSAGKRAPIDYVPALAP